MSAAIGAMEQQYHIEDITLDSLVDDWEAFVQDDLPDDQPGDLPFELPGDLSCDLPGDLPGDRPGDQPGDQPGDLPGDHPGDLPGDHPGDRPGDLPGEMPGDMPFNKIGGISPETASGPPLFTPGRHHAGIRISAESSLMAQNIFAPSALGKSYMMSLNIKVVFI
ncbi:hypothetical protein PF011_g6157 [Phytophthora fragariae]|uniref:Uncharacterized protein n=1 Tax=Phytophthora fragariae TaxID=53985 RepID=A0A6A3LSA5_9STRA|nr:hypothetical protein PF011_g6157 [Phytophthora fragariae]